MFTIAFAFTFAAGAFGTTLKDSPRKTTLDELRGALNTDEKFWLRERTYNMSGHECVYAEMTNITQTEYEFNQHYRKNGEKVKIPLFARLSEGQDGAFMRVSHTKGGQGLRYTLKFWDDTEKCGILMLRKDGTRECEKHVWNRNIEYDTTRCNSAYTDYCPRRKSYQVYGKECQKDDK
uniref:Putative group i salivary lipocalin n=1 Tax=Rhipicephalus pulchellus TaxID=72859 RepID=L7LQJ3_RHIPC